MGLKKKIQYPELSENEKKLQEKSATGTVEEVRALLQQPDVKVDCLDESGMTPLQQAAFRSKYQIAELLLSHGADVNSNMHENGYTALMFAALSGNTDMTRLMLRHGARKDRINSVNRNAAQMAAFVGQHQCVAVINNYYDKSDLEYYTKTQGQEKEPKLPPMVMPALLTLLNMSNMHPVKVSFHLQEHGELLNESYKVCKVLDLICERAMKSRDTDDVMAVKSHYFATVIRKAKDVESIEKWIKRLVRGRDLDGYPELQDQLIRQALKEFPYIESQLLQNMVRQLSQTKIGDHPTSLNILMQAVNGQKFGFDEDSECCTCGEMKAKKCTKCKMVGYCDLRCQKLHWPTHKKFCSILAEEYKKIQKKKEEEKKREEAEKKLAEDAALAQQNEGKVGTEETSNGGEKLINGAGEKKHENTKENADTYTSKGDQAGPEDNKAEGSVAEIKSLLQDPEFVDAFKDKDVEKALLEIRENPLNIEKYAENTKIKELLEKIANKFVVDSTETTSERNTETATSSS